MTASRQHYNRRHDFNFHNANFPEVFCSNIAAAHVYRLYISV